MAGNMHFSFTANAAARRSSPSLFQPPTSPSTSLPRSSSHVYGDKGNHYSDATGNDYFANRSRKRSRPQSQSISKTPPRNAWKSAQAPQSQNNMLAEPFGCSMATPFVNDRYHLAGGFDTPSLLAATAAVTSLDDPHGISRFRQERGCGRLMRDDDLNSNLHSDGGAFAPLAGPLARERNGASRLVPTSTNAPSSPGWTSLAFSLVGRVFNFGSSMVKGFYAGNGKGYSFSGSPPPSPTTQQRWVPPRPERDENSSTPVPGSWREDEEDDYGFPSTIDMSVSTPSSTPRPAHKRRQTERDSWVLVGQQGATTPSTLPDGSPRRKTNNGPRSRPSASRANSRRSVGAPLSRRQSLYSQPAPPNTNTHISNTSTSGRTSPISQPFVAIAPPLERRASYAPTRSPNHPHLHNSHLSSTRRLSSATAPYDLTTSSHSSSRPGTPKPYHRPSSRPTSPPLHPSQTSPLAAAYISPEAERFVRRQARADRAADRAIGSMSRRLEALIRQGQAALGTKVSVEGEGKGVGGLEGEMEGIWGSAGEGFEEDVGMGMGVGVDDEGFVDDEGEGVEMGW